MKFNRFNPIQMQKNKIYAAPRVYRKISIEMESPLLAGSVVENMNVESVGQEVGTFDFSTSEFNHSWGE